MADSLLFTSMRMIPAKAQATGYTFVQPDLEQTLRDLLDWFGARGAAAHPHRGHYSLVTAGGELHTPRFRSGPSARARYVRAVMTPTPGAVRKSTS